MITGDHVLTGCHVAAELRITDKPTLILSDAKAEHHEQKQAGTLFVAVIVFRSDSYLIALDNHRKWTQMGIC